MNVYATESVCICGGFDVFDRGHLPDHAHAWSTCSNKNIRQSILSKLDVCLRSKSLLKVRFQLSETDCYCYAGRIGFFDWRVATVLMKDMLCI